MGSSFRKTGGCLGGGVGLNNKLWLHVIHQQVIAFNKETAAEILHHIFLVDGSDHHLFLA
ncbi:hypothetical protein D3C74_503470 [compost metagenome]